MARRFPIFSFPEAVAQQILDNVPISELFEISLLSKRAFLLVKNKNTSTLHLNTANCEFEVVLSASSSVYADRGGETVEWHFCGKRDSWRPELEDVETRTVQVTSGESGSEAIVFAKLSQNCYAFSSDSIQDILQFVHYLSSLFNENVTYLTLKSAQFQHLKAIQSVEALRKSEQVFISNGTVSHTEMVQIIEGFESDSMKISCNPGPNFNYDRPISIRDFGVYTGSWVNGSMLLNLHSEHVTVKNADLTENDIIAFLNRQLENRDGCGNMWTAVIFRETYESDLNYEDRRKISWDTEKITSALSSYEQEIPQTEGYISKRLWRSNRTNFIDVTCLEEPSSLALLKDIDILEANASTLF